MRVDPSCGMVSFAKRSATMVTLESNDRGL